MTEKVAIYARYSCEQQRETSIDDQIRNCKAVAARYGLNTEDIVVFSDAALSGQKKHTDKRKGYRDLLAAMKTNAVSVVIADELSRLTRDPVENALLMELIDENPRLRLITATGMDTAVENWQLMFGISGVTARHEVRQTQHRVGRGMFGQLERGFMIATPPFGYVNKREFDLAGNHIGSHWLIDEPKAAVVREVFERRAKGQSMHAIARWLNDSGIHTSRNGRNDEPAIWRPARVKCMLQNSIYRGVFAWHGSTAIKYKAEKKGVDPEKKEFARPALRLVSDELWYRGAGNVISRSGYGGGKHAFAGLISCGCCGGTLVLSAKEKRTRSVYCASCTVAKSTLGDQSRQTATVAVDGITALLKHALKTFLTPDFIAAFRQSLLDRLAGDQSPLIRQKEVDIAQATRGLERLSKMLALEDDDRLEARYREMRVQLRSLEAELQTLRNDNVPFDAGDLAQLLNADPSNLIDGLFDEDIPPEELRAHLVRLFPSIIFEGKVSYFRSIFSVGFDVAAALSHVSNQESTEHWDIEQRFAVRYVPTHRREESKGHWIVSSYVENYLEIEELDENEDLIIPQALLGQMQTGGRIDMNGSVSMG